MLVLENRKLLAKDCVFDDEICAIHQECADDADDECEYYSDHGRESRTCGDPSQYGCGRDQKIVNLFDADGVLSRHRPYAAGAAARKSVEPLRLR
jgi:hypothetical protein